MNEWMNITMIFLAVNWKKTSVVLIYHAEQTNKNCTKPIKYSCIWILLIIIQNKPTWPAIRPSIDKNYSHINAVCLVCYITDVLLALHVKTPSLTFFNKNKNLYGFDYSVVGPFLAHLADIVGLSFLGSRFISLFFALWVVARTTEACRWQVRLLFSAARILPLRLRV